MEQFIARQPILNEKLEVVAYELFYRSSDMDSSVFIDGDEATTKVLSQSIFGGDINKIVGDKKVYINFTEQIILDEIPLALDKERLIVEVLETVELTPEVITALEKIKDLGYTIALDDVEEVIEDERFLELVDIIKVDFLLTDTQKRRQIVDGLRDYDVVLLAEKVETLELFNEAKEMGFTLFQGYFFAKPNTLKVKAIKAIKVNYLQLLGELGQPLPNYDKLTHIIESDVSLTYRVLRLVNSAAFYRKSKVQTIHQALVTLGVKQLNKWVSLIMIEDLSAEKPSELVKMSLIRGKVMETISKTVMTNVPEHEAFLVGLLSLVDVMTDREMNQILEELPLDDSLSEAILNKKNGLGKLLTLVEDYESSRWNSVQTACDTLNIDILSLPVIYFDAVSWTDSILE